MNTCTSNVPDTKRKASVNDLFHLPSFKRSSRTLDDINEPLLENEGEESNSQESLSFVSFLCQSRGIRQIFFMCILLALSIGSTIGVVPAVITDRYARLNHGYTGEKNCSDYGKDNMPLPCIDGSADAQTVTVIVSSISSLVTFVTSSLIGSLSDQYGRRKIILLGILLSLISPFLLILLQVDHALSPNWYFASSILSGSISWFTVALSSISDVTPKKWRAPCFGMLTAAFSIGFASSPSIALTMSHFDVSVFSFTVLFLCLLYAFIWLPETLPKEVALEAIRKRQSEREESSGSRCSCIFKNIMKPFVELSILNRNRFIRTMALLAFFSGMSSSGDQSLLIYYVEDRVGFKDKDIAKLFMIMGVGDILVLGCLLKVLNDLIGEKNIVILAFIGGLAQNTIYAFADDKTWIFNGALVSVLTGLSFPTISAMKSNNVDECEQGQIQGALYSLSSLASALGPMAMRLTYQQTIHSAYPGTFFLVGSGFFLIATVCAIMLPSTLANSKSHNADGQESCNEDTSAPSEESDTI